MKPLDPYIIDTLMVDLVGHDRSPASFVVWLLLWRRTKGGGKVSVALSLQELARATGLSKSAVQLAVKRLQARRLISTQREGVTIAPFYTVLTPWIKL